ncbi:ABC transporter ATP-binding protein [Pyrococcus furiosus DSM 3638]|uniref:ABC transporter (ATP-binding protein) n=3 Tax=Pyrococcus furiosus TaxID=2261 RepID=Q8U0R2_PYRFU|nr:MULTISPECIES: ABC transporter ATP-binding protein [Pyrococcus]AAL81646.1 putative ABC transporter (ATP-binding protein) [Pyrococcus furiosus DSM 3638]AFN04305.1 ABC transporter [Pyrococcus furiosus COM1]MDK2869032.1 type transport system ATP-binding protein [Pyrococcus sp.]QEK79147.1 ABC transporter ATP-binding protein [Pyrococcus furiosus DSM 3638]
MFLECWNVSKSYGEIKALDNVSFVLDEGLSFILGPNGSGKTTFIKIMSNIIRPDSGNIRIFGRDYLDVPASELGFAYEKIVFPPNIRVKEYLSAVGHLRGNDNSDEIITLFELDKVKNKRFKELSQGFKRRFLVASAFVGNPRAVFLDEPFSNVDIIAKRSMMRTFLELKKKLNIVIVSHVFTNIEEIDSLVVLYHGKVLANYRGKELSDLTGFRAIFEDGNVIINDVEKVNSLISQGKKLVKIEPISIEDWLMKMF